MFIVAERLGLGNPCTSRAAVRAPSAARTTSPSSGDVIVGRAGVYPARQETPDGGTKTVTFGGEAGNKVRQLHNHASNVTFDGLDVDANGGTPTRGRVREPCAAT